MHLIPEQDRYMPNMTSDIDRMEIRNNWNMLMPRTNHLPCRAETLTDHSISWQWERWDQGLEELPNARPTHWRWSSSIWLSFRGILDTRSSLRKSFMNPCNDDTNTLQLYYQVDTYHQMVVHGSANVKLNPKHATHCFEYLRSSIMCNMDMTLEGSTSVAGTEGLGQPHQCRNREEVISWIEARRVDDAQDIVGSWMQVRNLEIISSMMNFTDSMKLAMYRYSACQLIGLRVASHASE